MTNDDSNTNSKFDDNEVIGSDTRSRFHRQSSDDDDDRAYSDEDEERDRRRDRRGGDSDVVSVSEIANQRRPTDGTR